MPMAAALKLGGIKGTGIQKGREGTITVVGFRHDVTNEIDPRSGVPTKERTHGHFVITKNLDLATAALHDAQKNGKDFGTGNGKWDLMLFHMPRSGPESHYFTITLDQARVASIRLVMPDAADQNNSMIHEYEEVAFSYTGITWTNHPPTAKEFKLEGGSSYSCTDKGKKGSLAGAGVEFALDWAKEKAEAEVKMIYEQLKADAEKRFEELLKKAKEKAK